ncbi:hypothetical protein C8R44DRAFT_741905 [Mycena epipterygia]|nr:hypothetical protein C8R44DRAFT_741905 [Mycena epipterygia]
MFKPVLNKMISAAGSGRWRKMGRPTHYFKHVPAPPHELVDQVVHSEGSRQVSNEDNFFHDMDTPDESVAPPCARVITLGSHKDDIGEGTAHQQNHNQLAPLIHEHQDGHALQGHSPQNDGPAGVGDREDGAEAWQRAYEATTDNREIEGVGDDGEQLRMAVLHDDTRRAPPTSSHERRSGMRGKVMHHASEERGIVGKTNVVDGHLWVPRIYGIPQRPSEEIKVWDTDEKIWGRDARMSAGGYRSQMHGLGIRDARLPSNPMLPNWVDYSGTWERHRQPLDTLWK